MDTTYDGSLDEFYEVQPIIIKGSDCDRIVEAASSPDRSMEDFYKYRVIVYSGTSWDIRNLDELAIKLCDSRLADQSCKAIAVKKSYIVDYITNETKTLFGTGPNPMPADKQDGMTMENAIKYAETGS